MSSRAPCPATLSPPTLAAQVLPFSSQEPRHLPFTPHLLAPHPAALKTASKTGTRVTRHRRSCHRTRNAPGPGVRRRRRGLCGSAPLASGRLRPGCSHRVCGRLSLPRRRARSCRSPGRCPIPARTGRRGGLGAAPVPGAPATSTRPPERPWTLPVGGTRLAPAGQPVHSVVPFETACFL